MAFCVLFTPPQKFPLPLCLLDRVLASHGIHTGKKTVGIGFFCEIQQVYAILNGLVDQTVGLERLIAII